MVRLRISISDTPGALAHVTSLIAGCGGNIVEVYHQRMFQDIPVKLADLDAVVETRDPSHVKEIISCLNDAGFTTRRLGSTSTS